MFLASSFDAPPIDTRRALLVVDVQNDFVSDQGKFPVENATTLPTRVSRLSTAFRETGEVIWVTTEFQGPRETISPDTGSYVVILPQFLPETQSNKENADSNGTDLASSPKQSREGDPQAFLADLPVDVDSRCCLPGSTGAQMPDSLASSINHDRDLVLTKSDYSAFTTGPLLTTLRTNLVTELFLCGPLSNISLYATAIDATRYGFTITLVEDCIGHQNAACHEEAVRQMKEFLGAETISSSELVDLLSGTFEGGSEAVIESSSSINTRLLSANGSTESLTLRPKVEDWISRLHSTTDSTDTSPLQPQPTTPTPRADAAVPPPPLSKAKSADDPYVASAHSPPSPPRKRSTGDIDSEKSSLLLNASSSRRKLTKDPASNVPTRAEARSIIKQRRVNKQDSHEMSSTSSQPTSSTLSAKKPAAEQIAESSLPLPMVSAVSPQIHNSADEQINAEAIGEGDSYIMYNLMPDTARESIFDHLKAEVKWQKMYHRSGEVPRLVAVQGLVQEDDSVPIYRHPADESPPLLAFSPTVDAVRNKVEKECGRPFNHVLIQLYRSSEDNISEHSDKTLDIVRGSEIVNYSTGAQRTMILRAKKPTKESATDDVVLESGPLVQGEDSKAGVPQQTSRPRRSQRVVMPHNSLFVLGSDTNMCWTHSIRADRRRTAEKAIEELAFNGERISLTFRAIGTFINPDLNIIWGQGATSKSPAEPRRIKQEDDAEVKRMITAFGKENHQSADFDWDQTYGDGFDVVNFVTPKAVDESSTSAPVSSAKMTAVVSASGNLGESSRVVRFDSALLEAEESDH